MTIWSRPEKKPFRVGQLSQHFIEALPDKDFRCGAGKIMGKLLPQLTFKMSCRRHDLYWRRGGALKDYLQGMWIMYQFITIDTLKITSHLATNTWWGALIAPIVAFVCYLIGLFYVIITLVFGWLAFHWGKYRTLHDITGLTIEQARDDDYVRFLHVIKEHENL